METQNKYNEMELSLKNRDRFNFFKTSYNIDYTTKKLNKRYGFGKVNAFVGGDMLNPKLALKRDEINNKECIK